MGEQAGSVDWAEIARRFGEVVVAPVAAELDRKPSPEDGFSC